ncbi:hypothetical protein ICA16_17340 [Pseudomonas anatoliensis]|uniref:hypothetical protein n=1 Tax=Pseudomonas anatoliensis TaxID=2710589 RepID=UPI001B3368BA|nr:hypothetical protein [Pseudomonas anatoliensis]MBP5957440.1 hypothetical protein [Pseudomonas anatoliensis]
MSNQVMQPTFVDRCLKEIQQYDVSEMPAIRSRSFASGIAAGDAVVVPDKGSVVGEGILSFTGNLSDVNRTDAQNAFLFASLAANKRYPREDQGQEWYLLFRNVMEAAGWTSIRKYYNDLEVGGTSVRMDKLVLEILGSVLSGVALPGPTSALMLKVATDAIAALSKRETALTLYERNLLNNGVGGISTGACTEVNGVPLMAVGAVRFLRRNTSDKVLFVDVDVRNVKMYRGETVFEKNTDTANATRDYIRTKLGLNALSKIEEFEI